MFSSVGAQSLWFPPSDRPMLTIEALKPDLDTEYKITRTSSVWHIGAKFPIGKVVTGIFELPFVHFDADSTKVQHAGDGYSSVNDESLIANPYAGIEIKFPNTDLFWRIGTRLRFVSDEELLAAAYGIFTDYQRWDGFWPEIHTISTTLGAYNFPEQTGAGYRVGVSSSLSFEFDRDESFVFGEYFGQFWYKWPAVNLGIGISGRGHIKGEGMAVEKRARHRFGAVVQFGRGSIRPGLHFQVPLNTDDRDILNFVAGLNLIVLFAKEVDDQTY
jgi:hypothetical protein